MGVKVVIDCAIGATKEVVPGCSETAHLRLTSLVTAALAPSAADLRATGLTGEIADVTVHAGQSCGGLFPPEVKASRFTMAATPATAP